MKTMATKCKLRTVMTNKLTCTNILHVCIYVQNLNLLQPKLACSIVYRTKSLEVNIQCQKQLLTTTTKDTTTWECDYLSSGEISADLIITTDGKNRKSSGLLWYSDIP